VTLIGWMARHLGGRQPPAVVGPHAVAGYLALSRVPGFPAVLDGRTALLAARLAAELSGCRWCIDRSGHDWRMAGLPGEQLRDLAAYSTSDRFTERERAALAFVESVARSRLSGGPGDELVLQRARQLLAEGQLAELTAIVAEHHCLDSLNSNLPGP
jgi:alkylhydroperoxidase family enzyme